MNNQQDRRMLYEVTGMRLNDSEFKDESSSDSHEDQEAILDIDYAFMERFYEEDEEEAK